MSSKTKAITLRAFKVKDLKISKNNAIAKKMSERLQQLSKSSDRCMILNPSDTNKEKDVISNFSESKTPHNFFCTMLRLVPGEDTKHITDDLLKLPKFSIEDVEQNDENSPNICKEHFYFSINNQYLVTSLRGNKTITELQTYLAWFLENDLFELTPIVNIPEDIPLSDISNISGGGSKSRLEKTG